MTTPRKGIFIPPVLRGCEFIGVEKYDNFTSFVFKTPDLSVHDGVVRVDAVVKGSVTYIYSVRDTSTGTVRHYHGPHGDMEKDEWDEVDAI